MAECRKKSALNLKHGLMKGIDMKRILFSVVLLCSTMCHGEIYYDSIDNVFFTSPEIQDINAKEYDYYARTLAFETNELAKNKNLTNEYIWQAVTMRAIKRRSNINTPTSNQFLSDISQLETLADWCRVLGL